MAICECGCGEVTQGGDFRPGHEQKLRSAIEVAVGGILKLRRLVEVQTGKVISCDPTNDPDK